MEARVQLDLLDRPLRTLRVSVTDRCNLRCEYCMPELAYAWLQDERILTFEEIAAIVNVFVSLGVTQVKLTGGEPLLRRNLSNLVRLLSAAGGPALSLTTNGLLLEEQMGELKAAGLPRVTVSLDTLRPDRFRTLTRVDGLARVTRGIAAASRAFGSLKLDVVVVRGVNDDELPDLIEYGRSVDAEVRFIEYMDVGGATRWAASRVVPQPEIIARLERQYGSIVPVAERSSAPARRYVLPDGTLFGVIASVTQPFCRTCERSRLTADGLWLLCLYATAGIDLRAALRGGSSAASIRELIAGGWRAREDRGGEQRLTAGPARGALPVSVLRRDPRLEMHTRGG